MSQAEREALFAIVQIVKERVSLPSIAEDEERELDLRDVVKRNAGDRQRLDSPNIR